jgi:hypothetical protein
VKRPAVLIKYIEKLFSQKVDKMEEELDFDEDLADSDLNGCPQRSQTMPNIASFVQIQTDEIKIENIENEMDANENEIHLNNIEFRENLPKFHENNTELHQRSEEYEKINIESPTNELNLHKDNVEIQEENNIDIHKNNVEIYEQNIDSEKHYIEKHRKSSSPKILNSVFEDTEPAKDDIPQSKDSFLKSRIPKFPKNTSSTMSSAVNAYSKSAKSLYIGG